MKPSILVFCALTHLGLRLMAGGSTIPQELAFSAVPEKSTLSGFRWSDPREPYLTQLRASEHLEAVIVGSATDFQKVQKLTAWAHGLWKHNGDNEPARNDALSILQEAREGRNFRCVEYSVVLAAALNAVGVPARVLWLRTADVETRPSGAGHVVVEAYLADRRRWILADGQYDAIPVLKDEPVNAIELQAALARGASGLHISSSSGTDEAMWFGWIAQYLHYFNVRFDNRTGSPDLSPEALMLVPVGAKEPKIFHGIRPIKNTTYTHSTPSFYAPPLVKASGLKPSP
ncbi:MAG TPA: transglutaminase-like domain-containing protein [Candidatus Limnocylindria bacterium]|nr:transglutaminase-like domain-containing protein [Candidatus Limnocylindria bacterium]